MTDEVKNPQVDDENQSEAAALFEKIANEDSGKDSDEAIDNDSELDQEEVETDKDDDESDGNEDQDQEEQDPWSDAPEPLRQQYQNLTHANQKLQSDYNAVHGRLAPMQRELENLKKQVSTREEVKGGEQPKEVPTAEDLDGMSEQEIAAEYPELANFMKQRAEKTKAEFQQMLDERLNPLQTMHQQFEQQRESEQIRTELDKLAQVHPDFRDVVADPNFSQWVSSQPPAIQQIAASKSADDNIVLLNLYKGSLPAKAPVKPTTKKAMSDFTEVPRKGSGKAKQSLDDADPVELFNQIASG